MDLSFLDSLLGAAVGGLMALGGIAIQLRHSRRERQIDREWEQRRHVYLQAAEGVALNAQFLTNIANPEVADQDARASLQGVAGWLNKVHTVASIETIEALTQANERFLLAVAETAKLKFSVQAIDLRIQTNTQTVQQSQNELQQILLTYQDLANKQQLTQQAQQYLQTRHDELRRQLEALHETRSNLLKKQQELRSQLGDASIKNALGYERHLARVNICIRRELNLPLDETRYFRAVDDSISRAEVAFRELIDHIQQEIERAG